MTGAANGIGRAAALAFAREGASVVVADVSEEGNRETARLIEAQGGKAVAVRCDVTRAEDVKAALAKTVEAFGRLDFAFNNAGIEPNIHPFDHSRFHVQFHGQIGHGRDTAPLPASSNVETPLVTTLSPFLAKRRLPRCPFSMQIQVRLWTCGRSVRPWRRRQQGHW